MFWITQLCILILGPLAVLLAGSTRRTTRCWAGLVGVFQCPFWLWLMVRAEQYGLIVVQVVFTVLWLRVIWNNRKTIYVAGPMRGYRAYNFPRFFEMERMLRRYGWNVLNPARMDVEDFGFDPRIDPDTELNHEEFGFTYEDCMTRDIAAINRCDAIFLMRGWEDSQGANRELKHAEEMGLLVIKEVSRGSV